MRWGPFGVEIQGYSKLLPNK